MKQQGTVLLLIEETGTALGNHWPKTTRERKEEVALDGEASGGYGQHQMEGEIPHASVIKW